MFSCCKAAQSFFFLPEMLSLKNKIQISERENDIYVNFRLLGKNYDVSSNSIKHMIVFLLKQRSDFNFTSMVWCCVLQKGMTNKNSTTAVRTGYLQCMTGAFQGIDKSFCLPLKISESRRVYYGNTQQSTISMHILHVVHFTSSVAPTKRICLTIKSFFCL